MRAALLCLLLAAPAVWSQTAGTPAKIVADCIAAADEDSYGLEELEAACPGIEHALIDLGYSPFLSERQLEELSVYGLSDLERLDARYAEQPAAARADLRTDSLGPILGSLQAEQQAEHPHSWYQDFKDWLRSLLERRGNSPQWLDSWLKGKQLPPTVTQWIFRVGGFLLVALALAVLINELRVAYKMRRGAGTGQRSAVVDPFASAAELTSADLDAASLREKPSVLLRLLVAALVKGGRLRSERSLTHRELARRAAFDEAAQGECFGRVAALSERTVYGNARLAPEEVESVVQAGRSLLSNIAAPSAARGEGK